MERPEGMTTRRFLIRDRDSNSTRVLDDVFASDGTRVIMTPVQAPNANAFAALGADGSAGVSGLGADLGSAPWRAVEVRPIVEY
jgi:hypothetical protein